MNGLDTYLLKGPIDTSFTRKVITSNHIAYFCARCAGAIEVPTGTECCGECLDKPK